MKIKREEQLFNYTGEDYGPEFRDHILGQYRIYAEGIEKVMERRQNTNNYFITINTALATLIGLSFQVNLESFNPAKILLPVIGILISFVFGALVKYYGGLTKTKYAILKEMEDELPTSPFEEEWQTFYKINKKRGKAPSATRIEMTIPWIFGIIYLVIGIILFFVKV